MSDLKMYSWGEWPEHLLTKKQMDEAGYQTGKALPPPAAGVRRSKSPGGIMYLYDRNLGVPKRPLTDEQQAQAKARGKAIADGWRCQRCGRRIPVYVKGGGQCWQCNDHDDMVDWAAAVLADDPPALILDTETTGLSSHMDEIIQIAVIDTTGAVLFDSLIKPVHIERMYERGDSGISAHDIHGIDEAALNEAPTFPEVYPQLAALLRDRRIVIYNADFDTAMLDGDCDRHKLPRLKLSEVECAMFAYAQWYGEWSNYHEDYRWQPLDGGHSALEDCRATLSRIRSMANEDWTDA